MIKVSKSLMVTLFGVYIACCGAANRDFDLEVMDPVLSFKLRVNGWISAFNKSGGNADSLSEMVALMHLGDFSELMQSDPVLQSEMLPAYFLQCGVVDYPYESILIYRPMRYDNQIPFGDTADKCIYRNQHFFEVYDSFFTNICYRFPAANISLFIGCPDGRFIASLSSDRKKLSILDSLGGGFSFGYHSVVQEIPFDIEVATMFWKSKDELCVCFADKKCMYLKRVGDFAQKLLLLLIEKAADKILALSGEVSNVVYFIESCEENDLSECKKGIDGDMSGVDKLCAQINESYKARLETLKQHCSEENIKARCDKIIDETGLIIGMNDFLLTAWRQIESDFGSDAQEFIKHVMDNAKIKVLAGVAAVQY